MKNDDLWPPLAIVAVWAAGRRPLGGRRWSGLLDSNQPGQPGKPVPNLWTKPASRL